MNPAVYEAAEKLVTKWLRDLPSGNSLHVSLHFLIRFLIFHLLFRQCLWVFSMFSQEFLPVSYFRSYAGKVGSLNLTKFLQFLVIVC